MMTPTPRRLQMTTLEDRVQPATFGLPWGGADHLTLSFVPDGTPVDGAPSSLFGSLEAGGVARAAWQGEVLRAFQTWADVAGINVGVVPDSGAPLGAAGYAEGDTRFGDIRIAMRPLSGSVLAITTPPGVIGDTRAGDIVLNSGVSFAIGEGGGAGGPARFAAFDLFTTVLQESGHALGVGNSPDRNSPMFEQYVGRRAALAPADVGQIQSLYGQRAPDALEGAGNQTADKASELKVAKPQKGRAPANLSATADLSSRTDVDWYKLKVPKEGAASGLTVRVKSKGESLLAARLTVADESGRTVGTATSVGGVAEVRLNAVAPDATYYARVEGDGSSAFRVGKYKLKLVFDPSAPEIDAGAAGVLDDAGTNETVKTATKLDPADGYADQSRYVAAAVLRSATDVDVYEIKAQKAGKNEADIGTVTVSTLEPNGAPPKVEVLDEKGAPVSARVVANGGGVYTVQFGAKSDGRYYLRVWVAGRGAAAAGLYQLEATFRQQAVDLATYASGTLTAAAPVQSSQLDIARPQLQNFVLSAGSSGASGRTAVGMTIYDADGRVVATLFAGAGDTASQTVYLAPGRYTVSFSGGVRSGPPMDNLAYTLRGAILTDPIGSGAVDGNGTAVPVSPPPPAPGQGQPPRDYTWTRVPAGLAANRWLNPWG